MSNFYSNNCFTARKIHTCCECSGEIKKGQYYEKDFIVHDGSVSSFKTCQYCLNTREWLLKETDWPNDIDGEGNSFYYSMLREHLSDLAQHGDKKFSFKAYRKLISMDKRRGCNVRK